MLELLPDSRSLSHLRSPFHVGVEPGDALAGPRLLVADRIEANHRLALTPKPAHPFRWPSHTLADFGAHHGIEKRTPVVYHELGNSVAIAKYFVVLHGFGGAVLRYLAEPRLGPR